ncbi:MAG: response regulator [Eubacteriales bacterium]|nr:response regulator [Eubacteriales bacterium]
MDNLPVVLLVEQNTIVKSRVRNMLRNHEMKIYEAFNKEEVVEILLATNYNVDLIVSEIEIDPDNGFDGIDLIRFVKKKRSSIPVVMLTSISKKDVITRCLLEGAADYILKPFSDEYLKEKILKYINIESLTEMTVLKFNLKSFLDSEIYKAQKGKYQFSLLMVQFYSSGTEEWESPKYAFYHFAEHLYQELNSLFWESDLYIQHGYQSHLGFFPFCDQNQTEKIIAKINAKFEELKEAEPNMRHYHISHAFSTYPADGESASDLLNALTLKNKENISGEKAGEPAKTGLAELKNDENSNDEKAEEMITAENLSVSENS